MSKSFLQQLWTTAKKLVCYPISDMDFSISYHYTFYNFAHFLGAGCPQLSSVNISWCDLITQSGVAALAHGCRKMKTFISKGE